MIPSLVISNRKTLIGFCDLDIRRANVEIKRFCRDQLFALHQLDSFILLPQKDKQGVKVGCRCKMPKTDGGIFSSDFYFIHRIRS